MDYTIEGKDRFVVRKEIIAELKKKGYLVKIEDYTHKVGTQKEPRRSLNQNYRYSGF